MKTFKNFLLYQKTWRHYENDCESKETINTKNMTSMTEIYEDIYYSETFAFDHYRSKVL